MEKQANLDFVQAATLFKDGLPTEKQCDICFVTLIDENSGDSSSSSINFKPGHSWKASLPSKSLVLAQWYQESTKPVKLYRTDGEIKRGGVDRVLFKVASDIRDYYLLQTRGYDPDTGEEAAGANIANVFAQTPIDNSGRLKIIRFGMIDRNYQYPRGGEIFLLNYNRGFRKDVVGLISDAHEENGNYVIKLERCQEIPT